MTLRAQLIQEIITKIDQTPESKLKEILKLLDSNDDFSEKQKAILGFAGSWSDIDSSLVDELTIKLHENRRKNNRPIN